MFAQETIDVVEDRAGVCAHGHAGKSALEHRREKRGAQAFAGNIGDQKGRAIVADRENIEVVAANLVTGEWIPETAK